MKRDCLKKMGKKTNKELFRESRTCPVADKVVHFPSVSEVGIHVGLKRQYFKC